MSKARILLPSGLVCDAATLRESAAVHQTLTDHHYAGDNVTIQQRVASVGHFTKRRSMILARAATT